MFRRLFKLILGVAVGTALAHYFTSERGRTLLNRAGERLRTTGLDVTRLTGPLADPASDATGTSIEAKIEETRRRLREQLNKMTPRPTEETDTPR
jgi:hypothetical protein